MATSPSPLNYFIGKGTLAYTPAGGSSRSLGNCPSFKLTPTIEWLEHFSSMEGVKVQDDEVMTSKTGIIELTLDEITLDNLAIVLFGEDTIVGDEFNIMAASAKTGALILTGTNDKGNQFLVTVPKVNWRPEEGFDFISEEFGIITLQGRVLRVAGSFGTVEKTADGTLEMASWQELAGGEKVNIGGEPLDVYGIGIDGLNLIAHRFPEFIDMIIDQRVDLPLIVRDFPKACAVVLAAGIGEPGNEECETTMARRPLVEQIVLLEAIIRQTVGGDDAGPFVERVKRLFKRLGLGVAEPASETSPTNSQGPSSISKSADTLM